MKEHKGLCGLVLLIFFLGVVGGVFSELSLCETGEVRVEERGQAEAVEASASGSVVSVSGKSASGASSSAGVSSMAAQSRAVGGHSSSGSRLVKLVDDSRTVFKGMEDHFELISASPAETRFRFELGGYEVREVEVDGTKRSMVSVTAGWQSQDRGYPSLPCFVSTLACPLGKSFRVEVVDATWDEVPCVPPVASLGQYVRERVPKYGEASELYDGQGVWPPALAAVGEGSRIRQVSLANVTVSAASYDFGRGVMRVCRSCELRMVCEDAGEADYGMVSQDLDFRRLQTRHVLNGELLLGQSGGTRVGTLLMIVPDAWLSSVSSYASWKRQLGYEVLVSGYPSGTGYGKDGIGQRIRRGYDGEGVTHVLLAGRGENLPPAIFLSASLREDPGVVVAVSDVPYGLMDGASDLRQDVFLSRLGVSGPSELESALMKLRRHEFQAGSDSWRGTGLFVASDQGYSGEAYVPKEFRWQCDWSVVDADALRLLESGAIQASHVEYAPDASLEGLMKAWNGGAGLVTYMGHGSTVSWVTTGFSSSHVSRLTNGSSLPFVSSCVCLTGNFGASVPSLAESLVSFADGGACGVLASTNEVYIFPPLYMMQRLHDDIIGATGDSRHLTLGGYGLSAINRGIDYCLSTRYSEEERLEDARMLATQFHLLGDCSLAGRFRPSEELKVSTRRDEAKGLLEVTVLCGGVGREGSTVIVTDEQGAFRRSVRTEAGGLAKLALDAGMTGELKVAVFDPLGGYLEVGKKPSADVDGDGQVSHHELLEVLSGKHPEVFRQEALEAWHDSGNDSYVETTEERKPGELIQAGQPTANDYPFDCRKNPGGSCLADQEGLSVGTPEDVLRRTEELWLKNWEVCRPFYVGESVEGRRIVGARLGSVEPFDGIRVQLLITGGIHGNEEASMAAALGLSERLLALRQDVTSPLQGRVKEILRRCWIYVIPCLNPDGLFHSQRENAQGVDLDRAFPDGMAMSLGTYGAGDSLRLWEEVSVGEMRLKRGHIPEVRSLMRWCVAHRVSGALLLHSGGSHVYYPYGRRESGSYGEHQAPDQALLEELASGYAAATWREEDTPVNGAAWASVSGELGDWLYRYLGVLPLTVEVCQSRLMPMFEDWRGKFIDDQVMGLVWWLERCQRGVGGKVVDGKTGKALTGVRIDVGREHPVFTDGDGLFYKVLATEAQSVGLTFVKEGYATQWQSSNSMQTVQMKLMREDAEIIWGSLPKRPVPRRESPLELAWQGNATGDGARIIHVDAPAGWRFALAQLPQQVLAWRWERSGGLSLVVDDACSEVPLPVILGGDDTAEDRVTPTLLTRAGETRGFCRGVSAERITGTLAKGLSALTLVPDSDLDAVGFTWRHDRYELEPMWEWGRAYWLLDKDLEVSGWFDERRSLVLSPGWNLVGVPWTMPLPRGCGSVMTEERGQYVVGKKLTQDKGNWLFLRTPKTLEW